MNHFQENSKVETIWLIAGVVIVSFNLRPAITSVGPLIGDIRSSLSLSDSAAGLITTLPLILFGLLSPIVPKILQQVGSRIYRFSFRLITVYFLVVWYSSSLYCASLSEPNRQTKVILGLGHLYMGGILILLIGGIHLQLMFVSSALLGVGKGATVNLALVLISTCSETHQQTAELSGMAQSVGYLLAAIGPVAMGFIFQSTHSWIIPLLLFAFIDILMIFVGLGLPMDVNRHLQPCLCSFEAARKTSS